MILRVLGSSSSGNCYLLQSETTGEVLAIEAGVKFDKVKQALDYNVRSIVGCIISHEHGDHAKYVKEFTDACVPCYMSDGTRFALKVTDSPFAHAVWLGEKFEVGSFSVIGFRVEHDANEPCGFFIRHEECGTVLFATDTYFLRYRFDGINNVMLECNYRKDILDKNLASGRIDKNRYDRTLQSHMSFDNCLRTLQANDLSQTCNIVLLHLSDGNSNEREFVQDIQSHYPNVAVTAATKGLSLTFNKQPY